MFSSVVRAMSFVTPLKVSRTVPVVEAAPELDSAKPADVAEAERARAVISVMLYVAGLRAVTAPILTLAEFEVVPLTARVCPISPSAVTAVFSPSTDR